MSQATPLTSHATLRMRARAPWAMEAARCLRTAARGAPRARTLAHSGGRTGGWAAGQSGDGSAAGRAMPINTSPASRAHSSPFAKQLPALRGDRE